MATVTAIVSNRLPRRVPVRSSSSAPIPATPLAAVDDAASRSSERRTGSPDRCRSAAAAEAPATAASASTTTPLNTRDRVVAVAPGNLSASERNAECETVPQPKAVDEATPAMIA